MYHEDFPDWLEKLGERFAECDSSCDFSFLLEDIKNEVAEWFTGVDKDGSL